MRELISKYYCEQNQFSTYFLHLTVWHSNECPLRKGYWYILNIYMYLKQQGTPEKHSCKFGSVKNVVIILHYIQKSSTNNTRKNCGFCIDLDLVPGCSDLVYVHVSVLPSKFVQSISCKSKIIWYVHHDGLECVCKFQVHDRNTFTRTLTEAHHTSYMYIDSSWQD